MTKTFYSYNGVAYILIQTQRGWFFEVPQTGFFTVKPTKYRETADANAKNYIDKLG